MGEQIHATAVSLALEGKERGVVLLRGPSGSGKSDLALRLIFEHGGTLVADDRVDIKPHADGHPTCRAPAPIAGLLEVRGLGLIRLPVAAQGDPVVLVVDLVTQRDEVARLPEPQFVTLCNVTLPCLRLYAFDASTPAKIRAALAVVKDPHLIVR